MQNYKINFHNNALCIIYANVYQCGKYSVMLIIKSNQNYCIT